MFSKKYGVEEFGRTGRQRAVMQATFQKMLQQNPLDLVDIAIDALGDVSTDMDATYIKKLILSVAKTDREYIQNSCCWKLSSMWICFLCKFQSKSGSIKILYV